MIFFLFLPFLCAAQTTVGSMKMTVVIGLNISNINKMNFGTITTTDAGTITIGELGRTFTGGAVASGDFSADNYNLKGGSGLTVGVSLATSATVSNGVTTINIINFTSNSTDGKITLGADGTFQLRIWATAVIPQIVTGGNYVGTYSFTTSYQ